MSKGAGCVSGLGDSDGLCVAAHSRATSVHCKGAGCRPPLPLSFATHSQQSVGAGHARPAPLLCPRQRAEPFRASPAQKKAPLSKGDSPQCGEMSRSDRGARARRAGRVSGLGDSDGPCLIARYTRRRPGIPPPRLRSAPPFDKGGFLRGASGTPPTFLVKKLTAQILRFSACKSAPYVVQYKLTKYGKNRRNSKWNTAIRS